MKAKWLLAKWTVFMLMRRGLSSLNRRLGLFRRVVIVLIGVGLGWLLWRFGEIAVTKEILTNYLVAAGAMIGGATAIIFSVSIFLLQGVADLYSSRYFEEYATRDQQWLYAAAITIVLTLFGMALYVAGLSDLCQHMAFIIVFVSLLLIGLVFALIDWQFEIVRRKVVPANAVDFLERKALRFLRGSASALKSAASAERSVSSRGVGGERRCIDIIQY